MGKTEHRPWGSGILKLGEISSVLKNSKIGSKEMECSQYKLPATSGSERGLEPLCVAYVLVFVGIVIVCRISN